MQQCVKKDDKPASFMGGRGGVDQEIIIKVFKLREKSGNFIFEGGKIDIWRHVSENWKCNIADLIPLKAARNTSSHCEADQFVENLLVLNRWKRRLWRRLEAATTNMALVFSWSGKLYFYQGYVRKYWKPLPGRATIHLVFILHSFITLLSFNMQAEVNSMADTMSQHRQDFESAKVRINLISMRNNL